MRSAHDRVNVKEKTGERGLACLSRVRVFPVGHEGVSVTMVRFSYVWMILACLAVGAVGCNEADSSTSVSLTAMEQSAATITKAKKSGITLRSAPRAVADHAHYDFGTMDAMTSGEHVFTVRNEGSAPLKLQVLDTSCKCTISTVDSEPIPPGDSTQVKMTWNTGDKVTYYKQWARIETNDAETGEMNFKVEGAVRQDIRFEPEEIRFEELHPGSSQTATLLVFSSRLTDLNVERLQITNPNFYHEVTPATAAQLAKHQALCGYQITIHSPPDLPSGGFTEYVQIGVRPERGKALVRDFTLPIEGVMLSRLAVFGKGVDGLGRIELGTLPYGRGAKCRLRVKVRDPNTQLPVRTLTVDPKGVRVTFTPSSVGAPGLYDLEVEVPQDAEPCAHRGDAMGTIRLDFDHPRIPKLELMVDFSVRPPRELP
jgi:hypothetical protein